MPGRAMRSYEELGGARKSQGDPGRASGNQPDLAPYDSSWLFLASGSLGFSNSSFQRPSLACVQKLPIGFIYMWHTISSRVAQGLLRVPASQGEPGKLGARGPREEPGRGRELGESLMGA